MNQLLYNQIMHTLSDKIKSRKQNQTSQNNVINTTPYQITIGCATFKTQILSLDPRQLHDQFIDKMLTISQLQFNKSFKNNFPFFMMDFIKLYKRIQKKFKSISYKQQQFLVQKHTYCLKYEKLLKKKLFSDKNNVIIQTQQLVDVQQDQNIKQKIKTIFKYMTQCRTWDFRTNIIEINVLKHISHVNFTVLRSIKILNSPIQSLQPLIWMDLPELQLLQIGLLCSTSIKPLARCSLQSLRHLRIQYIFEYNENRMYQSKKSVDISPLSRLKLKKSLYKYNQIHTSTLYLYDSKKLAKIEWRIFDFPLINDDNYYITKSFLTYKPTDRELKVMIDRAKGYKIQRQIIEKQLQMREEQKYNQMIQLGGQIVEQKEKKQKIQVQKLEQKRQIIKEDNDEQKQKQDENNKQIYKRQRLVNQNQIQIRQNEQRVKQNKFQQKQKLNQQGQQGQQLQQQEQKQQKQQKEDQNQNQQQQQQQQEQQQGQQGQQNINNDPIELQINQQANWIQLDINQQQYQQYDQQYDQILFERPQLIQAINIGKQLIFYQYNSNSIIDEQMSAQQQQ